MATKAALLVSICLAFGAEQARADETEGGHRLAQTEKNKTGNESAILQGKDRIAAEENFSNDGPAATSSDKAMVTDIRFLTTATYTRVMLDPSQAVRYESHRLPADASKNLPPRIYVDIFGARLAMNSKESILIDDGLLRQVRVGQFSQDVVRVVLDMTSTRNHNAFLLPDPYRLVIDIQGQAPAEVLAPAAKNKPVPVVTAKEKTSPTVVIRKIVLDPGHEGKDPGAIGVGGIAEKDIVLSIAKKLAKKLQKEMGIHVVLTRKDDSFIPLEDRTAIANAENADLFVSLHMNASPNADARGIETYYLDKTNDEAAMRLAAKIGRAHV